MYLPFQESKYSEASGNYIAFGIKVFDSLNNEIFSVSDISLDHEFVQKLCADCNDSLLEPVHLCDVIEDYLFENAYK